MSRRRLAVLLAAVLTATITPAALAKSAPKSFASMCGMPYSVKRTVTSYFG